MFANRKFTAFVAVSFAVSAFPLWAQTTAAPVVAEPAALTQAGALEEIVVSARRRDETLISVPLAVSVKSATDIENAGVKDIKVLAQFTPTILVLFRTTGATPSAVR